MSDVLVAVNEAQASLKITSFFYFLKAACPFPAPVGCKTVHEIYCLYLFFGMTLFELPVDDISLYY